jgi:hypothetical protein
MNEKYIFLLLKIIKFNGNVKRLTYEGLKFNEIANLTSDLLLKNFAEYKEDKLLLTQLGESRLIELESKNKNRNKEEWIKKEEKSIIPKIDKDFIYLPDQNELSF